MLSRADTPTDSAYFDLSFSGLKTAVALLAAELEGEGAGRLESAVPDIAAEFQASVVEVLAEKTARAVAWAGCDRVVLGGGVACNAVLRQHLADLQNDPRDIPGMVAHLAAYRLRGGDRSGWELNADPALSFPGLDPLDAEAREATVATS